MAVRQNIKVNSEICEKPSNRLSGGFKESSVLIK